MSVLQFKRKEPEEPHLSGNAQCIGCGHKWVAVAPVGTVVMDCPECTLPKGRFRNACAPVEDAEIWQCTCGGDLFMVVKNAGYMCVACGFYQHGF